MMVMHNNDVELATGNQGFTVEYVYIVDSNDKKTSNGKVALNTEFSIAYKYIKNYTLKEGKAFPVLSILVVDNNQTMVIREADLLASYPEGIASVRRLPFRII